MNLVQKTLTASLLTLAVGTLLPQAARVSNTTPRPFSRPSPPAVANRLNN